MKRVQKIGVLVALTIFAVALATSNVFAADLAELIALADKLKTENPGIQLTLGTDKTEYQAGEKVAFEFTADKDCYLALIDIGTSGKTIILFPNKWHKENKIEKGKAYKIPPESSDFAYRIEGPMGTERIKAIACVEPLLFSVESLQQELKAPLEQSQSTGGTFLSMKNPEAVLKDIGIVMSKDPTKWSTLELQFKVAAAAPPPAPAATQVPAPAPQSAPPAPAPQPAAQPQAQPTPAPAQK